MAESTDDATDREVFYALRDVSASVTPEAFADTTVRLDDLGFDSLMIVQLVTTLEARLGVEIPDQQLNRATFETIGSVMRLAHSVVPEQTQSTD